MNTELDEWLSHAKTPETRARIRRWARWERFGMVLVIVSVWLVALLVLSVIVIDIADIASFESVPWLGWVVLGVIVGLIVGAGGLILLADGRRITAMYADGRVSVGVITQVTRVEPADPEMVGVSYDLTITATAPGTGEIRRVVNHSNALEIGQRIRFRHNTLDPENQYDALFVGAVAEQDGARR